LALQFAQLRNKQQQQQQQQQQHLKQQHSSSNKNNKNCKAKLILNFAFKAASFIQVASSSSQCPVTIAGIDGKFKIEIP